MEGMEDTILSLRPEDFPRCGEIWDLTEVPEMAQTFYRDLLSGNRLSYIYVRGDQWLGEGSLVFHLEDPDYTREGTRLCLSHLIVREEYRRQGIGRKLVEVLAQRARSLGYRELSVGVDADNLPALKLYVGAGFRQILSLDTDAYGDYFKLSRVL